MQTERKPFLNVGSAGIAMSLVNKGNGLLGR
jgi:hypothetical protein